MENSLGTVHKILLSIYITTQVNQYTSRLIDNIFTNMSDFQGIVSVPSVLDHMGQNVSLSLNQTPKEKCKEQKRVCTSEQLSTATNKCS